MDAATTSEAVQFITLIQGVKRELKQWESQVEVFHSGQKMLERNRFQFPSSWLHVDNVEGEWSAFNEIMKRKDAIMQTQVNTDTTLCCVVCDSGTVLSCGCPVPQLMSTPLIAIMHEGIICVLRVCQRLTH